MHSAIYQGWLRHRRFHPREHRFSYRVFMIYLDLSELDEVFAISPWWSTRRWRPAQFRRNDFLGDPKLPLDSAVRECIREQTGRLHEGPIRMLANLRYFGFIINPITCYYCFDNNEKLQTIVTEVTNTPWNDRQSYVLDCDPEKRFQQMVFQKLMHVSPFNPMDMTYHWCNNLPGKILSLNLETRQQGKPHVDATMALKRREISAASLGAILLQHPWMSAKVAATIYWQALNLWLKKVPFYDHPPHGSAKEDIPQINEKIKSKA